MSDVYEELMTAISDLRVDEVERLLKNDIDLNRRCDQGASVLFGAVLLGNANLVRLLLEHGADPNLCAHEPAATIYTEKPLNLARQARFLWDWDKYQPIVKLIEEFGGTDEEGQVESADDMSIREARAREWQACKSESAR